MNLEIVSCPRIVFLTPKENRPFRSKAEQYSLFKWSCLLAKCLKTEIEGPVRAGGVNAR